MNDDILLNALIFAVIIFVGFAIGVVLADISFKNTYGDSVIISNSTAIDICRKLLQNNSIEVNAYSEDGKLVCETPSYDSTLNIILKEQGK